MIVQFYRHYIKMENFSKAIVILLLSFLLACETYYVGRVVIGPSKLGDIENFNYTIFNDRVVIKGMVEKELFVGDLFPVEIVRELEKIRNPNVKESVIARKNQLAVARLIGNKGNIIECFVKQFSMKDIKKGATGRCYYKKTGEAFNVMFEKK